MENMEKIGIVAGSGELPISIVKNCEAKNIKPFIALIKDFAKPDDYKNKTYISITLGQVGKTISFFKKNNVKNIIFAGAVTKPNLKTIKPDFKGFFLLTKLLKSKFFGDDEILQTVVKFLEKEGFKMLPVDSIMDDIKIAEGIAGSVKISDKNYQNDIELGVKLLKQISDLDIGQSVIIQNGIVIGIECIEGTEKLIRRCSLLKYKNGRKPILVKIKKTNQTRKADLPSIGKQTIHQIIEAGFAGIAVDCDNTLFINKTKTIETANKNNIFIKGVKI